MEQHTEVLIETPFNNVLALVIDYAYLEDTYEEMSKQELIWYLQELSRALRS